MTWTRNAAPRAASGRLPVRTEPVVHIVIDARRGQLAVRTPDADDAPGLRRAPPHDVELQGARAPVVDDRAGFQRDAAVGEQPLVEGPQALRTVVDVLAAGGLAGVAVGLERRDNRIDVAGRKRAAVVGHDVRLVHLRVGLEQGRAARVVAGQSPGAAVDPQLVDESAGRAVGDDRHREVEGAAGTVKVEDHLLEAALLEDDVLDGLDARVVLTQPRSALSHERLESPYAL